MAAGTTLEDLTTLLNTWRTDSRISPDELDNILITIKNILSANDTVSLNLAYDAGVTYDTPATAATSLRPAYAETGDRLWKSKVDDNIGNAPPADEETTENDYWIEVSKAIANPIKEYVHNTVFGAGLVTVLYENALWKLQYGVRPFQSTDFETEIIEGKWVHLVRLASINEITSTDFSTNYPIGAYDIRRSYANYRSGEFNLAATQAWTFPSNRLSVQKLRTTGQTHVTVNLTNPTEPVQANDGLKHCVFLIDKDIAGDFTVTFNPPSGTSIYTPQDRAGVSTKYFVFSGATNSKWILDIYYAPDGTVGQGYHISTRSGEELDQLTTTDKSGLVNAINEINTKTSKYLGSYPSLAALESAHATANEGEYANVDAGIGTDVVRYLWDDDDDEWVEGASLAGGGLSYKHDATTDPGVTNDIDDTGASDGVGYVIGSEWYNATSGKWWKCTDNTDGAAVWSLIADSADLALKVDKITGTDSATHTVDGDPLTIDFDGIDYFILTLDNNLGALTLSNLPLRRKVWIKLIQNASIGYTIALIVDLYNPDGTMPDYSTEENTTTLLEVMLLESGKILVTGYRNVS